jgi:hypothetical protein
MLSETLVLKDSVILYVYLCLYEALKLTCLYHYISFIEHVLVAVTQDNRVVVCDTM